MYAMLYHIATPSWVWGPPPKDLMPHFFVRIFPVWEPMSKRNGWLFLLFQYSGLKPKISPESECLEDEMSF